MSNAGRGALCRYKAFQRGLYNLFGKNSPKPSSKKSGFNKPTLQENKFESGKENNSPISGRVEFSTVFFEAGEAGLSQTGTKDQTHLDLVKTELALDPTQQLQIPRIARAQSNLMGQMHTNQKVDQAGEDPKEELGVVESSEEEEPREVEEPEELLENSDFVVGARLRHFADAWSGAPKWHRNVIHNGLRWKFKSLPPTTKKIPRQTEDRGTQEMLRQFLKKGVIEKATRSPLFISRVKTVPKSNGKLRLILDLSKLNKFLKTISYKLPSIKQLRLSIPSGAWIAKVTMILENLKRMNN